MLQGEKQRRLKIRRWFFLGSASPQKFPDRRSGHLQGLQAHLFTALFADPLLLPPKTN